MLLKRLIPCIALLLLADPALAFRCQSRLVTEGDPQSKVRHFCGEPTSIQRSVIYRSGIPAGRVSGLTVRSGDSELRYTQEELLVHQRSVVEVLVEEWTYNLGPNRLMRVVRFENGVVTDIRLLSYGYNE